MTSPNPMLPNSPGSDGIPASLAVWHQRGLLQWWKKMRGLWWPTVLVCKWHKLERKLNYFCWFKYNNHVLEGQTSVIWNIYCCEILLFPPKLNHVTGCSPTDRCYTPLLLWLLFYLPHWILTVSLKCKYPQTSCLIIWLEGKLRHGELPHLRSHKEQVRSWKMALLL